ncbi:hypothetical protein AAFG07_31300 [Bradyrhizobium sp. B097]|uniref:hypothetical protein n=1 Tax=Bradyrhizobium sp. B097 TaxID=3140244 RepID=UPI0031844AA7
MKRSVFIEVVAPHELEVSDFENYAVEGDCARNKKPRTCLNRMTAKLVGRGGADRDRATKACADFTCSRDGSPVG